MSEFSSAFKQAFAIQRAIDAALAGGKTSCPIEISDLVGRVRSEVPALQGIEFEAAVVSAAEEAGITLASKGSAGP